MFADLKEKAAGVDRKRIYTAAAALLIAGAAGHFMQRGAGGSGPDAGMMAASVPAPAPAEAPEIAAPPAEVAVAPAQTAEPQPAPTDPTLAGMSAPVPEPSADAAGDTLAVGPASAPDLEPAAAPDVALAEAPADLPAADTPGLAPEVAMGPGPEPGSDPANPDVTRGTSEPILSMGDPGAVPAIPVEPADGPVLAGLSEPAGIPQPPVAAPAEPEMAACAIDLHAEALPGALLSVSLSAPCNSGETVAFEHAGLKFAERLGPDGTLQLEVPAMMGDAVIALRFDDGEKAELTVAVPDFAEFDRMALVWRGATGLQLHALEGGATYGEAGHIWADTPASPDAAISGQGGFVSVLGSTADGYAADVYTYPAALTERGQEPDISIEAQVMETTCGHGIEGWILRTVPGRAPNIEPLTMAVPDCDAVGEYLVLKSLPQQLTLARK